MKKAFVAIIILACLISLAACNDISNESGEREYGLKIAALRFDESGVCYVYVGLSSDLEGSLAKATYSSRVIDDGMWMKKQLLEVKLNESETNLRVQEALSEEQLTHNGVKYDKIKVVFRYDTVYKSVKSEAPVLRSGRYYMHCFELGNGGDVAIRLERSAANSANWYVMLAICGLVIMMILTFISLRGRKKYAEQQI